MASRYEWAPRAGRYRNASGRFVSQAQVRQAIDATLEDQARKVRQLAEQLRTRKISPRRWELQMREAIKATHMASAAAAKGGWAQMSPADYGRAGREIRKQYAYLERFAKQVKSGEQPRDGRFLQRADMYSQAARKTYHATERAEMEKRGMAEERNLLRPADHCTGAGSCTGETSRGWVAIGELIPIGDRLCRARCRCQIEYR